MADPAQLNELAERMLNILVYDRESHLMEIDDYLHNRHADPYMPDSADSEYQLLAKRSKSNWMPLIVGTPCQALYVDGFRPGRGRSSPFGEVKMTEPTTSPEWDHWQRSGLDARQLAVHRAAAGYGHAFVVTEPDEDGEVRSRGLSALRSTAIFDDPANDMNPVAAIHFDRWAETANGDESEKAGRGTIWDEDGNRYRFTYTSKGFRFDEGEDTGAGECPVTRFAPCVDLEGRTVGLVEPLIPFQDAMNQTKFDLLVAQSGSAFVTRWATGMAPPIERDENTGEPILDQNGQYKPLPMNLNAKKFLFGEDENVRFGTLDGTPLEGYIASIEMSLRHLAAASQTPPHYLLGQIANLSADALKAAETSLIRKVEEFQNSFGQSWERVFNLAGRMAGEDASANDFHGEVIWRDMESRSLAQSADALGKMRDQLGIPARGLWHRVPGATQGELVMWEELASEDDRMRQVLDKVRTAGVSRTTSSREINPDTDDTDEPLA